MEETKDTKSNEEKKIKILTEEEMDKNWKNLDHTECCLYQKLSLDFVKKHVRDIDWSSLSVNPNLTTDIIDKYINKISWASISINEKPVSDTILYNYRTKIYWNLLMPHQILNMKVLVIISEAFRRSRAREASRTFWKAVSRYQNIDFDYVDTYKRFLDFEAMSYNPYIDNETIDKFLVKMDANVLLKTRNLPKDLLQKHAKYLSTYVANLK